MKNKFKIIIVSVLFITEFFLLFLWYKNIWVDFTINLLTEVLGIGITIIIIDYLLQRDSKIGKREISDLAFTMSLKVCNEIILILLPDNAKSELKVT